MHVHNNYYYTYIEWLSTCIIVCKSIQKQTGTYMHVHVHVQGSNETVMQPKPIYMYIQCSIHVESA